MTSWQLPVTDAQNLPRRCEGLPPLSGTFVAGPEDFIVEEIPAYLPCGEGEHLFVHLRKQELTTQEALRRLARALKVREKNIGYAGLKDRHATTTQWLSLPGLQPALVQGLELPGLDILEARLHRNKLRVGHLRGNRFTVRVREVSPDALEVITPHLERLRRWGLPNFFGPQRFGRQGANHEEGRRLLLSPQSKEKRKRWQQKFLLSSYQAALFNDLLAHRMAEGLLDTVLQGDYLKKHETGGEFLCENPSEDQQRADEGTLSPTGVLPGHKVSLAQGLSGEWEEALLEREGLELSAFRPFGRDAQGTRRFLRVPLAIETPGLDKDVLSLSFSLPAGSYATVLLAELGLSTLPTQRAL